MGKKGEKVKEHPKTLIEVMSNTMDAITSYSSAKNLPTLEAALVLILNELRCIHWHLDVLMAEREVRNRGPG